MILKSVGRFRLCLLPSRLEKWEIMFSMSFCDNFISALCWKQAFLIGSIFFVNGRQVFCEELGAVPRLIEGLYLE